MEKWDLLTVILRDNKLNELLEAIYENTEQNKSMTETIHNVAMIWKKNNPSTNEIVESLIKHTKSLEKQN